MALCPECKARLDVDARYCSACGYDRARGDATATRTRARPGAAGGAAPGDERYVPGTVLVQRYRIVGLLGRGGMGEVYRAEDLKLGQPVALKFLPRSLEQDPDRLARLYNEVRLARQVSHPNICRVYDVGEVPASDTRPAQHFMTMEYVDGEDLASLLRRIGRLPEDKAVQIARQICAGLAAAHDQGVLHRDLKPANVMIDGRGQARITDFGVATLASEVQAGEIRTGTPAYMAPEQLAGREVTVQSDIYALGLLLYETFTGKPAFVADTLDDALRQRTSGTPTNPSSHVSGLDAAVEQAILRCLRPEPHERPAGALAVAAALPGGDPLAAALAAGETPSPAMVAAAPTVGVLSPALAWAGTVATVVLIVLNLTLASATSLVPTGKSLPALADRALETLHSLGYDAPYTAASVEARGAGRDPYVFWLRGSSRALAPQLAGGEPIGGLDDPPFTEPGMTVVVTDTAGKLRRFEAIPVTTGDDPGASEAASPDWAPAFAAAGYDPAGFDAVEPRHRPHHDVDRREAWEARGPDGPRIEAGSRAGRITWFEVVPPVDAGASADPASAGKMTIFFVLLTVFFGGILVAGIVLARRNLKSGRGDRRGALRLAAAVALASLASSMLSARHTLSLGEVGIWVDQIGSALFVGGSVWILYVAIEPEIRNRWPHRIVAWARALEGRFRDPLVGRDVLIGTLAGLLAPAAAMSGTAFEQHVRHSLEPQAMANIVNAAPGLRGVLAVVSGAFGFGLMLALAFVVVWLALFLVLRKEALAAVGFAAVIFLGLFIQHPAPGTGVGTAVVVGLFLVVMLRFGLLALVAQQVVLHLWVFYPLTIDPHVWYAADNALLAAAAVAPGFWGAWVASRGTRPGPHPVRPPGAS